MGAGEVFDRLWKNAYGTTAPRGLCPNPSSHRPGSVSPAESAGKFGRTTDLVDVAAIDLLVFARAFGCEQCTMTHLITVATSTVTAAGIIERACWATAQRTGGGLPVQMCDPDIASSLSVGFRRAAKAGADAYDDLRGLLAVVETMTVTELLLAIGEASDVIRAEMAIAAAGGGHP